METYRDFAETLQSFFSTYLVKERGVSSNTIRAYRDTFVHLLNFIQETKKTAPEKITLSIINRELVIHFLDWLEEKRGNSITTRNQRFAVLKSFSNYLMLYDPVHMAQWKLIHAVKMKKGISETVNYLTIDGIKYILEQIDTKNRQGRRNLTLLSLLYNTGARTQELIDLTPLSIRREKPYMIELFGKNSKKRLVPLEDNMMILLENYMLENNLLLSENNSHPLFYNVWNEKLTNPGITFILKKYASQVKILHPEAIPLKLSPHIFRHSRAMHLLQAGVNLVYIRDLLGHASVQTTEIYAKADSKLKREALEKAYADIGVTTIQAQRSWEKDPKLKTFLKSL
jgi:integrase/recombinase XerD